MTSIDTLYALFLQFPQICTDTRAISPNCLFFALKGDNFDANVFAGQALQQGAAYTVIDNPEYALNEQCLLVEDVLTALQQLARHHRSQLNIPVIGLTGSNGKTTTKELIRAVLAEKFVTHATKGNLNNHIGVPLTLLAIDHTVEIAIIEMGANHQHEIELLCALAQPTHGLITNVGMAHLEGFGGFEGVKKGKAELYAYLKQQNGLSFIYADNTYLMEMSQAAGLEKIVYYGKSEENTVSGQLIQSDPFLKLSWNAGTETHITESNLTGTYNFENILGAICIGNYFGLSPQQINAGLAGYAPKNNRSQLMQTENNRVICDFYNANPSSMAAALQNLAALNAERKVAVIGDMFELGPESAQQHRNIAKLAASLHLNQLIFIGKDFYKYKDEYPGLYFQEPEAASEYLTCNPVKDTLVLLKGSRGMALERLLPLF